jgi:hypothetical protein
MRRGYGKNTTDNVSRCAKGVSEQKRRVDDVQVHKSASLPEKADGGESERLRAKEKRASMTDARFWR